MSRTRKFGTIAAVAACAAFVAGCGGGDGYTAAESAPTPTAAPTAAAPAAAAPAATPAAPGPLGSFAPSDPATVKDQTFSGYDRFPRDRAGKIFVGPAAPKEPAAAPEATPPPATPGITIPSGSGSGAGTGSATPTPSPVTAAAPGGATPPAPAAVTTKLAASLTVDNKLQTVVVGNPIPAENPLFTVQAITNSVVTLKANSGALAGGGTTIDLAVGQPVTLSNPSTGAQLVINVVEIKAQV